MGWSFPIGRILGSELRVHLTFLLLLLWIGVSAYVEAGAGAAAVNTVFVVLLFACVVAHEYGHALMARRYGIKTPDITLLPIGGLARLDRMPEKPAQEIAVALAGPAVNLVIWAFLTLVLGAGAPDLMLDGPEQMPTGLLDQLATVNLYLLLFNLLPAFPMDGGRVLRAALSAAMGRTRGTLAAARVGQAFALAFGLAGLVVGNPFLILIAAFVFFAASGENNEVALSDMARNRQVGDAMISKFQTLGPDDPLSKASEAIIRTTQHEFPVVDHAGRPVGFLSRQAVFAAVAQGQDATVGDLMDRDVAKVSPRAPLKEAITAIAASPFGAVLVTDAHGQLLGYVSRENLAEMMLVAAH